MKKRPSLTILLFLLCWVFLACNKSNGTAPATSSRFSFSANDSTISFPVNLVFIQDVDTLQTTVINGQYADTSSQLGNISIRVLGDTTGRFSGKSLLVSYTDATGKIFINTSDSSNFVQIDKFPKTPNGMVSGSFTCIVANVADSIRFTGGIFMAPYQD